MDDDWNDLNATIDAIRAQRPPTAKQQAAKKAGRARQKQGSNSEKLAAKILREMGFKRIKRLKTMFSRNGMYAVKAEADFKAIGVGGRYVLIEVKDIVKDRLPYSRIEKHQRKNLDEVHELGGLSLLIITHNKKAAVLEWPIKGFVPRSSIKWYWAWANRENK